MSAFTISACCAGCGAECNRTDRRFGCRACFDAGKDDGRVLCERCARNHPDHKPPPKPATLMDYVRDRLAKAGR